MQVITLGIDLAKSVFQICGVNQAGKPVFNVAVKRNKLLETVLQYPDAECVMEACSGSNYWGRLFLQHGYVVKLIPPQHVKPFVRGNKNDRNDAFAITEAARRPQMMFLQPRSVEATDMAVLHRIRLRRQKSLTCLTNQLRGLLAEYGIVLEPGVRGLKQAIPELLEQPENGLSDLMRQELSSLYDEWRVLEQLIQTQERHIEANAKQHPAAKLLMSIKGVGSLTATALLSLLSNPHHFKNGRHFAASLGLTPSEHSSGGKHRLGKITKRGNCYLRWLLVQCAMSHLRHLGKSTDSIALWLRALKERRGNQVAAVALANKLARICWAVLAKQEVYKPV